MLVVNSFDLWQKDSFFSAAEEVQESADILESAYRAWLRAKREETSLNILQDLNRELQTALGTAKWQMEEFERAVQLSYGACCDENRVERHQKFLVAMECQISHVENALRETLHEEGKQPLRWVNLDEEERDDLAMFLSGSSESSISRLKNESFSSSPSSEREHSPMKKQVDYEFSASCSDKHSEFHSQTRVRKDEIAISIDAGLATEINVGELSTIRDDQNCQGDRVITARRTWTTPHFNASGVEISSDCTLSTYAPSKVKGFRFSGFIPLAGVRRINQLWTLFWVKIPSRRHLNIGHPIRLMLAVMLTFFLFGIAFMG